MPYTVPLRHVRPHIARALLSFLSSPTVFFTTMIYELTHWPSQLAADIHRELHLLLDYVDAQAPTMIRIVGSVADKQGLEKCLPHDVKEKPPQVLTQSMQVAQNILHIGQLAAIAYGTQLTNLSLGHGIVRVTMLAWRRTDRQEYVLRDIDTTYEVKLKRFLPDPQEQSIICFVRRVAEEQIEVRCPDLDDISRIEKRSLFQTPRQFTPAPEQTDWWQPTEVADDNTMSSTGPSLPSASPPTGPPPDIPPPGNQVPAHLLPQAPVIGSPLSRSRSREHQPGDLYQTMGNAPSPPGPPPPPAPAAAVPTTPARHDRSRSRQYSPMQVPAAPGDSMMEQPIRTGPLQHDMSTPPQSDIAEDEMMASPPPLSDRSRSPHRVPTRAESSGSAMPKQGKHNPFSTESNQTASKKQKPQDKNDDASHWPNNNDNEEEHLPYNPSSSSSAPNLEPVLPLADWDDQAAEDHNSIEESAGDNCDDHNATQPYEEAASRSTLPYDNDISSTLPAPPDDRADAPPTLYCSMTSNMLQHNLLSRTTAQGTLDQALCVSFEKQLHETECMIREGRARCSGTTENLTVTHTTANPSTWSRADAHFVFQGPFQKDVCFYVDLNTLEAFRVDADTDNLNEAEIIEYWQEVEAGDWKEIEQFVRERVWRCKEASHMTQLPIDAILGAQVEMDLPTRWIKDSHCQVPSLRQRFP